MKKTTKKRAKIPASDRKIITAAMITLAVLVSAFLYLYRNPTVISDFHDYIGQGGQTEQDILTVHFIDVGQGDAELFALPSGEFMLIDAGPNYSEEKLLTYLQQCGVSEIEYAVFTHPHEDHIGGADYILENITVKNVIMPDATADTKIFERLLNIIDSKNINLITAEAGQVYTLGGGSFTILGPLGASYKELNNYSVVLRFDYGAVSFLMTGDCEAVAEAEMLLKYPASAFKCEVMKIGHHGSNTSSSEDFLTAASPRIAVIECGDNNFNHPNPDIVARLKEHGMTVLRTDLDSPIVFTTNGVSLERLEDRLF